MEPTTLFPSPFPEIAKAILISFDEANWGEEIEEPQPDAEDADMDDASPSVTLNHQSPAPSNRSPPSSPSLPGTPVPQATNGEVQIAADEDPIFGAGKLMHDIDVVRKTTRKSYRINVDYDRPSSKVFGHNNIAVGTVFPLQIAAFRDGAHGEFAQNEQ